MKTYNTQQQYDNACPEDLYEHTKEYDYNHKTIKKLWSMAEEKEYLPVATFIEYLNYVLNEGVEDDFENVASILCAGAVTDRGFRPSPLHKLMQHAFEWGVENDKNN